MAEAEDKAVQIHYNCPIDPKMCGANQAKIEQVLSAVHELGGRIDKMHELHRSERKDFWEAVNELRESITGNSREGLKVRIDRNTQFRRNLSKLLWALFTPLYGGLVIMLIKLAIDTFSK